MIHWRSIGFRLTAWYTGILACILLVAGMGVWFGIRGSIHATVDKDLRSRLDPARAYVEGLVRTGGRKELARELNEDSTELPGVTLMLADTEGNWIYRSPQAHAWSWAAPAPAGLARAGTTATAFIRGKPLRILTAPISFGVIQLAAPLDEYYEMLSGFSFTALWTSPILLAMAAAAGYWMSQWALRPVDAIALAARRIGARNLSERLPVPAAEDELQHLSITLNEMLDRLETAFDKIRRFTADASHELRTPIAVVQTTADVISSKVRTDEEHRQAWKTVQLQTRRMSRMIDDLLALARSDDRAGGASVSEPFDLAEQVRRASGDTQVLAAGEGVKFVLDVPDACPMMGDSDGIRRLISIILDNAVKYTPQGEIAVTLKSAGAIAVIQVRDTGVGIAPDDLPRIFDRFYRTDKDRSRRTGGAGLGLSIAHSIVTRHGGEISVSSQPGVGTTVRITLPVLERPVVTSARGLTARVIR